MEACKGLLAQYEKQGDAFLERIITGDETWVHFFEPETKQQSMQWKHLSSPPPRKFKGVPSLKKIMYIVFWDRQGIIVSHPVPEGVTITG